MNTETQQDTPVPTQTSTTVPSDPQVSTTQDTPITITTEPAVNSEESGPPVNDAPQQLEKETSQAVPAAEPIETQQVTDEEAVAIAVTQTVEGVVVNEEIKQAENNDKKLTGFQLHPENINRNGRPSREWTWSGLLEKVAEEEKVTKTGNKIKWKELVAKRLFHEAMNGNVPAIKELMNRMDGMPDQNQNINADRDVKVSITRE